MIIVRFLIEHLQLAFCSFSSKCLSETLVALLSMSAMIARSGEEPAIASDVDMSSLNKDCKALGISGRRSKVLGIGEASTCQHKGPEDTTRIPQGYHKDATRIPQGYHKDTTKIRQGGWRMSQGYHNDKCIETLSRFTPYRNRASFAKFEPIKISDHFLRN